MNKSTSLFLMSIAPLRRVGLLLLFAGLLLTSACKTKQKIVLNNGKCLLDFKNSKTLTGLLKANEFHFDRLNGKLSVEANIDSSSNSFTVNLRMKKDSIIWMSISKMGIEGARVLITKDSVKLINRISNKYFKGDYAYISKILNTELDYEMLQSLLIGNSVEFYDEDEKIKPGVDDCMYTLGTVRKFKMRRVERGKDLKEPAQTIYMNPGSFKIARIIFYEFNPDRSFDAKYTTFDSVGTHQSFPMKMNYSIKAQKNITIDLAYTKLELDAEQSFPFRIPEDYEQIIVKDKN